MRAADLDANTAPGAKARRTTWQAMVRSGMRASMAMLIAACGAAPAAAPIGNGVPSTAPERGAPCDAAAERCLPDAVTLDGSPLDRAALEGRVVLALTWAAWDMPGVRTFASACDVAQTTPGVVLVALLIDDVEAADESAIRAAIGCDAILVPATQLPRFGEVTSVPFVRAYGPRGHAGAAASGLQREPELRHMVLRARQPEPA